MYQYCCKCCSLLQTTLCRQWSISDASGNDEKRLRLNTLLFAKTTAQLPTSNPAAFAAVFLLIKTTTATRERKFERQQKHTTTKARPRILNSRETLNN